MLCAGTELVFYRTAQRCTANRQLHLIWSTKLDRGRTVQGRNNANSVHMEHEGKQTPARARNQKIVLREASARFPSLYITNKQLARSLPICNSFSYCGTMQAEAGADNNGGPGDFKHSVRSLYS
ncbi:hypothetical protein NDU88_002873 [Pleurodeles waltl]|uniref:Uncharacterized protein n=1 Tax=Pleurodeles waltl TaxID=8319 RepID=A0AAV7VFN9_PLEWA|nr:hypothetical protein NDU88_002873 [Pleurodeles waltl]